VPPCNPEFSRRGSQHSQHSMIAPALVSEMGLNTGESDSLSVPKIPVFENGTDHTPISRLADAGLWRRPGRPAPPSRTYAALKRPLFYGGVGFWYALRLRSGQALKAYPDTSPLKVEGRRASRPLPYVHCHYRAGKMGQSRLSPGLRKRNPKKHGSEVPTLAKSARVGHPQS
jgi:hypothetical protein